MATEQEIKPVKRSIEEYYLEALNKIKNARELSDVKKRE